MVHALERARRHLAADGSLVLIQPRPLKRPFIAVVAPGWRRPVGSLINPLSEPLLEAANGAIRKVVDMGLVVPIGKANQAFRVSLANPSQLAAYLYGGVRPPRFPPGGRKQFLELWRSRPPGARIQVTEYLTVMAFRKA